MRKNYQLFYFFTCPYCWVVRVYLCCRGIRITLRESLFSSSSSDELIAGGGKYQVPCLRIEHENGEIEWMYESMDIIRYFRKQAVI